MSINSLFTIEQEIKLKMSDDTIKYDFYNLMDGTEFIYSYIIYSIYKEDILYGWRVKYMISEIINYNVLDVNDSIYEIINIINKNRTIPNKKVIGYKQPPLNLLIELYQPLINKLAFKQFNKWKSLDLEDAYQMCCLVIIILYRKGYYLHKRLIEKSYNNYILMHLRKERDIPPIVSFSDILSNNISTDDETLYYNDILADNEAIETETEKTIKETRLEMFEEIKREIIDLIGERRYKQLLNDYANKHTSSTTQRLLYVLKAKLNNLGLTKEAFYKKYYE